MRYNILVLLFFTVLKVNAQTTWSADIAPILFEHCTNCHRPDGIAPFSLLTYTQAKVKADIIEAAVLTGEMPPWPADENYTHFAGELVLTAEQKFKISQWVLNGLESGDTTLVETPVYNFGTSVLDTVHASFSIGEYTTQYDIDEYRHFVIQTEFTEDKYFNIMEIVPGNWNLVHHVDMYLDGTGESYALDQLDTLAGFNENTGWPVLMDYIGGWSPGSGPLYLPTNWGIKIPQGYDLVVQIHYAPNSIGLVDSTRINFTFVNDTTSVRQCVVDIPLYNPLGQPLVIPADSIITFYQRSSAMDGDKSFVAFMPHMHMLGRSYKIWYETVEGDSIPVIDIPKWDFHWQYFYTVPIVMKVPDGARFHAIAVYDNTSDNVDNPNDPPIDVYEGSYTKDEMLMTFMAYTDYEAGDEFIIVDSTNYFPLTIDEEIEFNSFDLFPNPTHQTVTIASDKFSENTTLTITNIVGKTIIYLNEVTTNINQSFSKTINVSNLPPGIYIVELISGNTRASKKLVIY
jgi:hypothetical protein